MKSGVINIQAADYNALLLKIPKTDEKIAVASTVNGVLTYEYNKIESQI